MLAALAPGLTSEMVAATSKIMRNQDLIAVSRAATVTSAFRTTIGLPGRLATRLQPNHPVDDPRGVAASVLDGLLMGCGDAVVGINPASDSPHAVSDLLHLLDEIRQRFEIPTQSCVLTHVTTTIDLIEKDAPVDLVFQSVAGTEGANRSFGVDLAVLREATRPAGRCDGGPSAATSCTSRPGRVRRCRREPMSAPEAGRSISRRSKRVRTPLRASSIRCSSTRSWGSSDRNTCTTASRSSARVSKTSSAANFSACRWVWTSATPTMPRPTRTTWTPC